METTTARRYARSLIDWGYTEVQMVEEVATGTRFIKARNRCGMPRTVSTLADFLELKELEVGR